MKYQRFEQTIIVRMDKGEDIVKQVKNVALKEKIKLASISALGAINEFTVGVFKTKEKKYYANEFKGDFEIVSLIMIVVKSLGFLEKASKNSTRIFSNWFRFLFNPSI